ncbi:hypothetical protein PABG_06924 [Paracoccidioides brasiliensis Pb03]|nr:hypothetical protein PABG_06924 [Paracoccidioides brasiliensis Pb03]
MCRIRRWIDIVIFFGSGRRGKLRRSQDPRAVGDGEIEDLAFRSDYISVIDDMENGRGRETSRLSDQISEVQFLGQISIIQKFLLHNDQQQASEIAIGCLRIATVKKVIGRKIGRPGSSASNLLVDKKDDQNDRRRDIRAWTINAARGCCP